MNKYHIANQKRTLSSTLQVRLSLAAIMLLTAFFALIAWPTLPETVPGAAFFNKFYPHLGLDLQGGTHLVYEADLSAIETNEKNAALEGARDVIERRVNTLGVAEPVVQTANQAGKPRIIVELAGIKDVNQAIQLIGDTPLLEFKETQDATATSTEPSADQINAVTQANLEKEKQAKDIIRRLKAGESFDELSKQYSDDTAVKDKGGDLGFIAKGIFTPVFEKTIFDEMKVGELRSEPLKTEFGYHVIKKLEERKNESGETEVRSAHILLKTVSLDPEQANVNWVNTQLSGKNLKRAQVTFDYQTNEPQVNLTFDAEGAKLFEAITERNISKPVGIFLDGAVISAPTVQTAITGGEAVISGNFDLREAKLLAQRLNAGALPVPITLINQQTIGASLGYDSLQKSLQAGIIGFIFVGIFMLVYYRLPGLLSVLALLLYAAITQGIFEMVPVTLTLAGVAGFILSVGMAVDANILIFERVREELKRGNTFTQAVEEGFTRAWSSIRDSNVSSLITCAILYWFGTSIIRGFAVTLAIGIMVSMFSAITVTRTLLRVLIKRAFVQKYWLFGVRKPS